MMDNARPLQLEVSSLCFATRERGSLLVGKEDGCQAWDDDLKGERLVVDKGLTDETRPSSNARHVIRSHVPMVNRLLIHPILRLLPTTTITSLTIQDTVNANGASYHVVRGLIFPVKTSSK